MRQAVIGHGEIAAGAGAEHHGAIGPGTGQRGRIIDGGGDVSRAFE